MEVTGIVAAERLSKRLDCLDDLLRAAERTVAANWPANGLARPPEDDYTSRLAELDRREQLLLARERAVDAQQRRLWAVGRQLQREKDSLKRALERFRREAQRRSTELESRASQLAEAWAELREARRALARIRIRLKGAAKVA